MFCVPTRLINGAKFTTARRHLNFDRLPTSSAHLRVARGYGMTRERQCEERRERQTRETRRWSPHSEMSGPACARLARELAVVVVIFVFICSANRHEPPSTPPPKPKILNQGCPPDLLHSRALRSVQLACRTHPATVVSAFEGIQDALGHCSSRLRFQQWDCSGTGNIMHDPPLLRSGYRESALVWALSSAGAAWGVATACAQGWIEDCACTGQSGQNGFEYGGCTYAVQHGITASRKLLTKTNAAGNSLLRKVEKHNLKAGRLAVKKTLISSCKCHGVSGSCQQKTCWKRTAQLEKITDYLVDKYARARLFIDDNSAKSADLIFLETSPDVCKEKVTAGRVCAWRNDTHTQGDCDRLCCGNGFSIRHEVVRVKCDCQFVWCCSLVCKDCIQHRWVSTCNGEPPKSLIFKK